MNEDLLLQAKDWMATLFIGALVASWWRGTWVLFDIWLCDQPAEAGLTTGDSFCYVGILEDYEIGLHRDTGGYSLIIGAIATILGIAILWSGLWRPQVVLDEKTSKEGISVSTQTAIIRLLAVYVLGIGAVNVWRGVWYLTDYFLFPDKFLGENQWGEWPLGSFWFSSVIGSSVCFLFGAGNSILAPPGIFLLDGPGVNPPPIAVTMLSSYYSITLPAGQKPPEVAKPIIALDLLTSFCILPFFVVWFWRGSWLVLDYYLWEFSPEKSDVWVSIGESTLIALLLMFATSETAFSFIVIENKTVLGLLGRLRTYILAWGVVNYWRAVWYIWDELAGTSQWSCWVCHIVPLGILIAMGSMSCILAPASTMGVDAVPHEDCADEPLFSNLPVPSDDLYFCAIARNPQVLDEQELPKETLENKKSFLRFSMMEFSEMIDVDDVIEAENKKKTLPSIKEVEMMPRVETESTLDQNADNTEERATTPVDAEEGMPTVPPAINEDDALAKFAADVAASEDPDAVAAEEAEMAAAWAHMENKMGKGEAGNQVLNASTAWASAGTGRRGSYSSVRTQSEAKEHRSSYFDLQRADLDRRVSRRESAGFVPEDGNEDAGTGGGGRRASTRGSIRRSSVRRGSTTGEGTRGSIRRTSDLFRGR